MSHLESDHRMGIDLLLVSLAGHRATSQQKRLHGCSMPEEKDGLEMSFCGQAWHVCGLMSPTGELLSGTRERRTSGHHKPLRNSWTNKLSDTQNDMHHFLNSFLNYGETFGKYKQVHRGVSKQKSARWDQWGQGGRRGVCVALSTSVLSQQVTKLSEPPSPQLETKGRVAGLTPKEDLGLFLFGC